MFVLILVQGKFSTTIHTRTHEKKTRALEGASESGVGRGFGGSPRRGVRKFRRTRSRTLSHTNLEATQRDERHKPGTSCLAVSWRGEGYGVEWGERERSPAPTHTHTPARPTGLTELKRESGASDTEITNAQKQYCSIKGTGWRSRRRRQGVEVRVLCISARYVAFFARRSWY